MNFPFIFSTIPVELSYRVCISQFMRYSRACGSNRNVLDRKMLLTRTSHNQWFLLVKLKSSLRKYYGHHHGLMKCLSHKWPRICSKSRRLLLVLSTCMTYHGVCNLCNMTVATSITGNVHLSGAPENVHVMYMHKFCNCCWCCQLHISLS